MALTALHTRDSGLLCAPGRLGGPAHPVVAVPCWGAFSRLVRERPVTVAVIDAGALEPRAGGEASIEAFRRAYPNVGLVLISKEHDDPVWLFRLGRARVPNLILIGVEDVGRAGPRAIERAAEGGAAALVTRALAAWLPPRELEVVHAAMDGVHRRWSTDEFARALGFSRPFLSDCLRARGLPSLGHLLIWTRLLHAGFWLEEPGRTGESVSRQLEYSSGAAFRRALRHYTGATPTEVAQGGGLVFVLSRFLEVCGRARDARVTAA